MISNTDYLFLKAKRFQDERAESTERFEADLQKMERFKGSKGYDEDIKRRRGEYESEQKALIEEYRQGLFPILGYMMDAIGKRSVSAPTSEQVNLLSVLKMKKKISLEECQRVAEAVKENPICISVLNEIAHEHGYLQSFDHLCSEMSSQRASEFVMMMKNALEDFLQYDTTKTSRATNAFHEAHYGASGRGLTKRPLFENKEGCFKELFGMEKETLNLFSDVVDTE